MQRSDWNYAGATLSVCRWEGAPDGAPVFHWAHATGLHAQTYAPLLAPLAGRVQVYAYDARGHGQTTLPADAATHHGWDFYRDDMVAFLEHLHAKTGAKIWLGGHSMGGAVSILAAAARPDLVAGLVLADPVVVPRVLRYLARGVAALGLIRQNYRMAAQAENRRADWPDSETAKAAWRGRGSFAGWPEAFLEAHVAGGFRPLKGGGENTVRLACAPAWEAANYRAYRHNAVAAIRRLRVPFTLLMAAQRSTTMARRVFHRLPVDKDVRVVPDSNHFLPITHADLVRDAIIARIDP